ncbi:hypothetical protein ACQP1K_04170 [Sphaerimonospora sp. CA-214678]|uniref:hypothetical protein n=1 Tax=Sphaerimonospora sp. CA-214678 TaxID=3240029 RepID=UPI003D908B43
MRRSVVTVAVVLVVAGCTAEPERPKPPPVAAFTQEVAEAVLAEVVAGVGKSGITDFCAEFARSKETCATLLKDASRECLLPGDRPTVKRAVHESATRGYEETWKLVVQGSTLDGQRYVSDFPVVLSEGEPKAAFGVYWTGLGSGRNMNDPPNYTIRPKNACPR